MTPSSLKASWLQPTLLHGLASCTCQPEVVPSASVHGRHGNWGWRQHEQHAGGLTSTAAGMGQEVEEREKPRAENRHFRVSLCATLAVSCRR